MPARSLFLKINHSYADSVSYFLGQSRCQYSAYMTYRLLPQYVITWRYVSVLMSYRRENGCNTRLAFLKM